ncbi:MAG TPA: D-glycerate dehydrogenase, partial [Acidimicrobiia bacterium]|nr:D-glycerate dehydrogenase [Acidimicrobiia bacterium]
MARVLITHELPPGGTDPLVAAGHEIVSVDGAQPLTHDKLVAAARDADAIVCLLSDRIDTEVLAAGADGGRLRVVANVAVGYDNIDVTAATEHGIAVCNTPGVLDDTTADLALLLILAATRCASDAEADLRAGRWTGWGINEYLGQDVHGAILGLVGLGRIGQAVLRRATGFNMRVVHHTRHDTALPGYVGDLDRLLAESDIVSLHVPLNEDSFHLIGARELALMKPSAVLVNTSRGPVIDEEALATALEDGTIFAAGLDVFEHEPEVH